MEGRLLASRAPPESPGQLVSADNPLHDLVRRCTVRVYTGEFAGTGVLVAPGQVLTCAHLIGEWHAAGGAVTVVYNGVVVAATVRAIVPAWSDENQGYLYPPPDLAWLEVDLQDHPCAQLDAEGPSLGPPYPDELWAVAFTTSYDGRPGQFYGWYVVTGPMVDEQGCPTGVWQLNRGEVKAGMSGSPMLNCRTGKIVGLVTRSRDLDTDVGGWGIHVAPQLEAWPELVALRRLHDAHHAAEPMWANTAAQAGIVEGIVLRRVTVVWECDDSHPAAEAIPQAASNLSARWPDGQVRHVRYSPGQPSSTVFSSTVTREDVVAQADVVIVVSENLLESQPCLALVEAASGADRRITLMSSDPASMNHDLALEEIGLPSHILDRVDLSQTSAEMAALNALLLATWSAERRAAGSLRGPEGRRERRQL